jgi:hypothetical protein
MLTSKPQTPPYIRVFKVATGEEIIANVVEETSTAFNVKQPLCMVPTEKGYQFAPFMMMADPEQAISLRKDMLVADATGVAQLVTQYESITTGIALPQKSKIIT